MLLAPFRRSVPPAKPLARTQHPLLDAAACCNRGALLQGWRLSCQTGPYYVWPLTGRQQRWYWVDRIMPCTSSTSAVPARSAHCTPKPAATQSEWELIGLVCRGWGTCERGQRVADPQQGCATSCGSKHVGMGPDARQLSAAGLHRCPHKP